MSTMGDADSQGEYPDAVPADGGPGEYTESVIPGDPVHAAAVPGTGQFTDSDLADEPDASRHAAEDGRYTDSQLAAEPDASDRDADGSYTESEG